MIHGPILLPTTGFPKPVRDLAFGEYPLLTILPDAGQSPALGLVGSARIPGHEVVLTARVRLIRQEGFCWVDETVPCIVLTETYYIQGSDFDLYLDLLHEATHIRHILEGRDVWDDAYPYHRRPTEIEGYAVAVAECRRFGLDERGVRRHLSNPWMTPEQVSELLAAVEAYLRSFKKTEVTPRPW